ncbi:hypothetical protein D0812_22045 [Vibrio owensii]|uniref:Uncharacterized protein n=1 Tax=Vibrio owensii TaxID=696485 RepID=A0AAP9GFJ7_9VIBR|nr:hypothetical protein [Vibrio owensii]AYO17073.1 hypothetical protein D0812_22045 [Vibrio owensii]QGH49219.1 hypothetical protein APZ19_19055 [Vibrio owensii]
MTDKKKPAETLSVYLDKWGVKITEVVEVSGRTRSTVDEWWRRQDLAMLDMAVSAIIFNTAVTQKAKNFAIRRKLGA